MKKRKAIVDTMMRRLETGRTERMHTKRELQKWSKAKLIREVIKLEFILLKIAVRLYKSKLPRLKTTKRKALFNPYGLSAPERGFYLSKKGKVVTTKRRKKKRKFSVKQLKAQRLFAKRAKAGTLRRRR